MDTFRKVMAVPMGLTALALLWLCWRLGGANFALIAAGLTVAMVLGLARTGKLQRSGGRAWATMASTVVIVVAVGTITLRQSFAPPAHAEQGVLPAQPFSEAALAEARASGKPVFAWFTADWCLTCKVNESVAIEREGTRDAFRKAGVVALEGDWTRRDPAITRFLTAHGAAGVPLYLWYPAGGEGRQLGQVLTPDSLVELARQSSRAAT
jgi:thiol:disulfide interchange protein